MSARDFLNNLTVTSPCFQDWTSMSGNDQVRFCEHCSFQVHNISEMTRAEALRLVAQSRGRLCVRYYRDPQGGLITRPLTSKLHTITRRASRLAASAFSATLSVSAAVAQQPSGGAATPVVVASQSRFALGASVVGTVADVNGALIPGASVTISSADNGVSLYASTDQNGQFRFDGLAPGMYTVQFAAPGFASAVTETYVAQNGEVRVDRTLQVAGVDGNDSVSDVSQVTMGVVAFVAPEDPFIKAAQEDDIETVQALLANSDINLRDNRSNTTALEHAVQNANREMVQLLLSKGADVNAKNSNGMTVLMMVDENATVDLIWDLVNAGANVNAGDSGGNTALIHAAWRNNVEALKTLIEAGSKLEAKNENGETALMRAASSGVINNVRALLVAGAVLNERNKEGKNALMFALENDQKVVIRYLRSQGAIESVAQVKEKEEPEQ